MTRSNSRYLVAAAALATFLVTSPNIALSEDTINVGLTFPKSGPNADSVRRFLIGPAEWAAKLANAKGGVLGRQIKTISEDSRDPSSAVSALRKLVDVDGIVADLSSFTPMILPQLPVAEEKKIPIFGVSVSHPDFTKSPWGIRLALTGEKQAVKTADVATDLGVKTAVYICEDNDAGRFMQKVFETEFTKRGGKLLATESYKMEDNDMRGQLTKLKSYNADALYFMGTTGRPNALILKQMAEVRFQPKHVFGTFLMEDAEVRNLSPDLTEGVVWVAFDIDPAFAKDFKAEFGYEPDTNAGTAVGSMELLIAAIKRVGSTDGTKLRDAIFNYGPFKTPDGTFTFTGSGDPEAGLTVKTMKAGKIVPYTP
jgi:branched-chain amino acid transport system substrate-binding protein